MIVSHGDPCSGYVPEIFSQMGPTCSGQLSGKIDRYITGPIPFSALLNDLWHHSQTLPSHTAATTASGIGLLDLWTWVDLGGPGGPGVDQAWGRTTVNA